MIKISYNSEEEMMHIESPEGTAFFGNYWDFSREPEAICEVLRKLGLDVKIDEDLPSIG